MNAHQNIYEISCSQWHLLGTPMNLSVPVVFAIGDVHGQDEMLQAMHEYIDTISNGEGVIVHLGDLIDRGPYGVRALRRALSKGSQKTIVLPGNHEQFMIDAIRNGDSESAYWWLKQGGRDVLVELGIIRPDQKDDYWTKMLYKNPSDLYKQIRDGLGHTYEQILKLPTSVRFGNLVCVHAGIPKGWTYENVETFNWVDAGVPESSLAEDRSPLWVRGPFLYSKSPMPDGTIVCHGHTIFNEPQITPRRVGIDTGAYRKNGALTMAEFRNDSVRFHRTSMV